MGVIYFDSIFQQTSQDLIIALENNTNGLQDFNYVLQSFYHSGALNREGSSEMSQPSASLMSDPLRDVANLLFQFILALEADVS